jgi:hypothetical protein
MRNLNQLENSKIKVKVDNIITWIQELIYKDTGSQYNKQICPLCKEEFKDGEKIYLLINNYELFPNILIHSKCVTTTETLFEDPDWKSTVKKVKEDYLQAKKYKCWYY